MKITVECWEAKQNPIYLSEPTVWREIDTDDIQDCSPHVNFQLNHVAVRLKDGTVLIVKETSRHLLGILPA